MPSNDPLFDENTPAPGQPLTPELFDRCRTIAAKLHEEALGPDRAGVTDPETTKKLNEYLSGQHS